MVGFPTTVKYVYTLIRMKITSMSRFVFDFQGNMFKYMHEWMWAAVCEPITEMSVFIRTRMINYYQLPHSVKLISVAVRTKAKEITIRHTELIYLHVICDFD